MDKAERKAHIAELERRIANVDRRRRPGVATAGGIKPSYKATSVTDLDRYDIPEPVRKRIEAERVAESIEMANWVEEKRAAQKANAIGRQAPRTRVEALVKALVDEMQRSGGLPESMMREIQGEYWKQGQTVTIDQLKSYAGQALNVAAQQHQQRYGHRNEGVVVSGGVAS